MQYKCSFLFKLFSVRKVIFTFLFSNKIKFINKLHCFFLRYNKLPAKHPVIKLEMLPIRMALMTNWDKSLLREGTIAVNAPNTIPMEETPENPHILNVAIASARS